MYFNSRKVSEASSVNCNNDDGWLIQDQEHDITEKQHKATKVTVYRYV